MSVPAFVSPRLRTGIHSILSWASRSYRSWIRDYAFAPYQATKQSRKECSAPDSLVNSQIRKRVRWEQFFFFFEQSFRVSFFWSAFPPNSTENFADEGKKIFFNRNKLAERFNQSIRSFRNFAAPLEEEVAKAWLNNFALEWEKQENILFFLLAFDVILFN